MDTCQICYEKFNKSTRQRTECPRCNIALCRTCLQTYLVGDISDVPRCVNPDCGHGWEREFLDNELTRQFRLVTYKEHREKVLADREKARLPATQEEAANYKRAKEIVIKKSEELGVLTLKIVELERERAIMESTVIQNNRVVLRFGRATAAGGAAAPKAETKMFIRPCPAPDCKGFLSTAWKCGLCDQWSCPTCHDLKGANKDVEHTCDPAKVATAELIEKESKPCPKCGARICKIDGCDQMWCTACNTAFNWRTGTIANGPVHNPHYFDWLRRQGNAAAPGPAAAGAGAGAGAGCLTPAEQDRLIVRALSGGNYYIYGRTRSGDKPKDDTEYLYEVWRLMREAQDPYVYNNREADHDEQFRQLRVKYMAGEVNEEDWKVTLQRIEKDANFMRAKAQVRDVFVNAARDLIAQVLAPDHNKSEIRKQLEELLEYCNECYKDIAKRFGRKTPTYKVSVSAH